MTFWLVQALNGISFGMLLFLLAAGLSLVTTKWLRIDVAAQFANERNAFAAGLAGRF